MDFQNGVEFIIFVTHQLFKRMLELLSPSSPSLCKSRHQHMLIYHPTPFSSLFKSMPLTLIFLHLALFYSSVSIPSIISLSLFSFH